VNEEEKIWKTSLLLSATDLRTPMIEVALQSYDVICSYRMDHPKNERSTLNMSQYNLDRIFQPRRVAVVGASEKARSIGNAVMKNLLEGGYKGMLLPVNLKYDSVHGMPAVKSVSALETGVDLAVIATPIATVPDIVRQCVEKKVAGAIVISAGGKEVGEKGKEIEEQIRATAYAGGLRIIGPNCLGIIRPGVNLNASFASEMPDAGDLAFVSQSGAICTAILDLALKEHIGFSHFVSIGSMLDVDFGDLIDYLGNDSSVKSILLYIESLTNFRKFMSAARAVSRIKPIIVLKAGRSEAGAKAAASHTGAMAGEDAVYDAAFKRAGIVRVDTIEELFDCAELMAKQPRPRGPRLAILTNGGGPSVMAADTLARYGETPEPLDPETIKALDAFLPPFWSRGNPIDILGDADPERYTRTLELALRDPQVDGVAVIYTPQGAADPVDIAKSINTPDRTKPILAAMMGDSGVTKARQLLLDNKVPAYEFPEDVIKTYLYMYQYARNLEELYQTPEDLPLSLGTAKNYLKLLCTRALKEGRTLLNEADSKKLLTAYGIQATEPFLARDEAEAASVSFSTGFPLVKIGRASCRERV